MAHAHDTPKPPAIEQPPHESSKLPKANAAFEESEAVLESAKLIARPPTDTIRVPAEVSGPSIGPDRRRARRAPLEVPVTLRIGRDTIEGTSEDISMTGIFVQVPRLLPSGRRVHVQFGLPQGEIVVQAIIVRFRTPTKGSSGGVGLCFTNLTHAQEEEVAAYCVALGGVPD